MTTIETYAAPQALEQAARLAAVQDAHLLAGGTDLLPRWTKGLIPAPRAVVDLKRVSDLHGITRADGEIRVGACTPLSALAANHMIRTAAPVLTDAADRVACPQIRNRATIGGNLCNASPAADTAIPLILLDAVLELVSVDPGGLATRDVPIADFFRGPGTTVLAAGEVLTHIRFRSLPKGTFAAWDKFGTRRAMEIAVASVGVALRLEGEKVAHVRVGYGSVAPIPLRGNRAEERLLGKPLSTENIDACVATAQEEIAPISDVRASAAYRRQIVGVLLRRMLERAMRDGEG